MISDIFGQLNYTELFLLLDSVTEARGKKEIKEIYENCK